MSQTNEDPVVIPEMTAKEFAEAKRRHMIARAESGRRCGPVYNSPESAPLVWFDQVFERGLAPAGTVVCGTPLRVGSTQNGLDILLVASHGNTGAVNCAKNATITLTLAQADEQDGEFTEVGPSLCLKAPEDGISAEPCMLLARLPIGNFSKPWLKPTLTFAGSITGGLIDCCLGYVPR